MKKIVFTGGGSGGHFFPLLAIITQLQQLNEEGKKFTVFYFGEKNDNTKVLEELNVKIVPIISSKIRRYFSLANILELPKFFLGLVQALIKLYFIMPDVIFSKGGPGSLPVVLAGAFYMIPIIIHESDSLPSLTTSITARFAKTVAISFDVTAKYLPVNQNKIKLIGNPIREDLLQGRINKEKAKEILGFKVDPPLLLVLGGSQGAKRINNFIFDNFDKILQKFQILHQVGKNNMEESIMIYQSLSKEISSAYLERYKMIPFLSTKEMALALSACDIVLSRAGAGAIFEIAAFGKPSILIPLPESAQDHQRINAYQYEEKGACFVLEEKNLTATTFFTLVEKILQESYEKMSTAALQFAKPEATALAIEEILPYIKE